MIRKHAGKSGKNALSLANQKPQATRDDNDHPSPLATKRKGFRGKVERYLVCGSTADGWRSVVYGKQIADGTIRVIAESVERIEPLRFSRISDPEDWGIEL